MPGGAHQYGEAASGTNSALCPACFRVTKRGAAFCFGCFCKLPMGVKYMLADARRRMEGISVGKRMLAERPKERTGDLFQGENR